MDILYVALGVLFFLSGWGLLKLCEVLGRDTTGEKP